MTIVLADGTVAVVVALVVVASARTGPNRSAVAAVAFTAMALNVVVAVDVLDNVWG